MVERQAAPAPIRASFLWEKWLIYGSRAVACGPKLGT